LNDFEQMNAVYACLFAAPYAARTTIEGAAALLGTAVEMDLVAR
jgi:hypothetical protein